MQFAKMSVGFAALQETYGADAATISALMAATGLFGLIFGVSGASITSSLGFRRVLFGSLVLAAILSFAEAFFPPIPVFYGLRLLEGVTNLFIVVAAPTLISLHAPKRYLPFAMGLWGTFYGVAFALTGLVGPALLDAAGPRGLLVGQGSLALITFVLLARRDLANPTGSSATSPGWKRPRSNLLTLLRTNLRAYRHISTALPGAVFFFHSSIYLGFLIFVPLSAPSDWLRGTLLVSMPLVSIAGTIVAGPLVQSGLPLMRTLISGFASVGMLSVALAMVSVNGSSVLQYLLLANAVMLISGILQGSIFILAPRLAADPGEEAIAFGVIAQLGSLGSIVGPIVFAIAIERAELTGFAGLVVAGAVMGALIAGLGLRNASASSRQTTHGRTMI